MNKIISLNIYDVTKYINRSIRNTNITKPFEVGTYSYDDDNNLFPSEINKYCKPNLPIDISEGFKMEEMKPINSASPLTPILTTLENNKVDVSSVDFITYRNNLNKIFGTYCNKDPWTIDIERLDSTIHLGIRHLESEYENEEQAKSMYSGFKFEELSTSHETKLKYCSIVQTELRGKKIILAAEIDCYEEQLKDDSNQDKNINDNKKDDNNNEKDNKETITGVKNYIELKTNKVIVNERVQNTFERFKLFKFWLQSYLAGVSKIICGFRDDNYKVIQIREYNTHDLPRLANGKWDTNECLIRGNEILDIIKNYTKPNKAYQLQYIHPMLHIYEVNKISSNNNNNNKYEDILNENYRNYFNSLKNNSRNNIENNISDSNKKQRINY